MRILVQVWRFRFNRQNNALVDGGDPRKCDLKQPLAENSAQTQKELAVGSNATNVTAGRCNRRQLIRSCQELERKRPLGERPVKLSRDNGHISLPVQKNECWLGTSCNTRRIHQTYCAIRLPHIPVDATRPLSDTHYRPADEIRKWLGHIRRRTIFPRQTTFVVRLINDLRL